jgi:hypothetical protein
MRASRASRSRVKSPSSEVADAAVAPLDHQYAEHLAVVVEVAGEAALELRQELLGGTLREGVGLQGEGAWEAVGALERGGLGREEGDGHGTWCLCPGGSRKASQTPPTEC